MLRRALLPLLAGLALSALPACHTRPFGADGGRDGPFGDAGPTDVASALALDFVATGCAHATADAARGDGGVAPCTGKAPLTLTFSPVSSASLTRFRWTFGDGTPPSSERAPTHTYLLPGSYDVAVVAEGTVGSLSRQRPGFVEVASDTAGAPCDVDRQCGEGLFCLCGEGAPCGDGFTHGICTRACPTTGCGAGAACALLAVPPRTAPVDAATDLADASDASSDASTTSDASIMSDASDAGDASTTSDTGPALAPAPLCLAACGGDADCASGLVCRTLPGETAGAWTSVCVPSYLRRVSDSCRDARGQLDDHVCATGLCADLGALGLCSASCAAGVACPSGTACATFGDGRALCVATCSTSATCVNDPLLDCETGKGGGALGFLTSPPAPTATFCAPRVCTSQADCAPSGTCKPLGVGAHCVAN